MRGEMLSGHNPEAGEKVLRSTVDIACSGAAYQVDSVPALQAHFRLRMLSASLPTTFALFIALTSFIGLPVMAETVSSAGQLVPGSFSAPPILPKAGSGIGASQTAVVPPGADGSSLLIGNLTVEGLDPRFSAEADALIAPLRGQMRPVSDIYDLAARVQKLYSGDGSFLTRVVIPPQKVQNGGTVKLKVIEGFIADIDVTALAPEVRGRISQLFIPLKGRPGLKLDTFERALLLASSTAGVKLRTNLKPAEQALGVTLTVSGDYDPLASQIVTDNGLSATLGTYQTTFSSSINSPLHQGEQIYMSITGSPTNGGFGTRSVRRVFAIGANLPLAANGLSGNVEYTWSATQPIPGETGLATASRFQRISAKISYPVILDQTSRLDASIGFDHVDEINRAVDFDYTLYHDRLNVVRAGVDYSHNFLGGVELKGGFDLSQGLSGLANSSAIDARRGDPFTKLQARIRLFREYESGFAWALNARGQYSARARLTNTEKFVIGGTGDLSGSDSGSWSGDHGWSLRSEIQYDVTSYFDTPGLALKSYLFAARSQIYTEKPTSAELAMDGATGFGLGLRGQWTSTQFPADPMDFAIEAGRSLSDNPSRHPDEWRVNLSVGLRF